MDDTQRYITPAYVRGESQICGHKGCIGHRMSLELGKSGSYIPGHHQVERRCPPCGKLPFRQ